MKPLPLLEALFVLALSAVLFSHCAQDEQPPAVALEKEKTGG